MIILLISSVFVIVCECANRKKNLNGNRLPNGRINVI